MIDGMAVACEIGKPTQIKTCVHWAHHFTKTLESKIKGCDEIYLVFDCYNLKISLKEVSKDAKVTDQPLLIQSRQHTNREK